MQDAKSSLPIERGSSLPIENFLLGQGALFTLAIPVNSHPPKGVAVFISFFPPMLNQFPTNLTKDLL